MSLPFSNIVPKVCLFDISHGKSAQMLLEIVKSGNFMLMQFFYGRCSIRKEGVHLSKQKVTLRIEEGEVELLKEKYHTDNQSEAIRLAIMESLATEDSEKLASEKSPLSL